MGQTGNNYKKAKESLVFILSPESSSITLKHHLKVNNFHLENFFNMRFALLSVIALLAANQVFGAAVVGAAVEVPPSGDSIETATSPCQFFLINTAKRHNINISCGLCLQLSQ